MITYGRMKHGSEPAIVGLIMDAIESSNRAMWTNCSAEWLSANRNFVNVEVAEEAGVILGFCAWTVACSTWRGELGIHMTDLHVREHTNRKEVMRGLCIEAARAGETINAQFLRSFMNTDAEDLVTVLEDLGFNNNIKKHPYYLDREHLQLLLASEKQSV